MTQMSILGEEIINASPTIVVNKFMHTWELELQGVKHKEGPSLVFFRQWFLIEFGCSDASVTYLIESRLLRTLQDKLSEQRSLSGV